MPWFAIDGEQDEFYAALMWSGAWSLGVDSARDAASRFSFGLAPMTTTTARADRRSARGVRRRARRPVRGDRSAALVRRSNGIRAGRPLAPLVTYNTWFAYGTEIDERVDARRDGARRRARRRAVRHRRRLVRTGTGSRGRWTSTPASDRGRRTPVRFPERAAAADATTRTASACSSASGSSPSASNLSVVGAGRRRRAVARDARRRVRIRSRGADLSGRQRPRRQWLLDQLDRAASTTCSRTT